MFGFYWCWTRSIFDSISCCVGSLDCVMRFWFFSGVSVAATFEFRCFSKMSSARALYFEVVQPTHRVWYRVVDFHQFCVASFGVSFAVAMHALLVFLCNAIRICFLLYLLLSMFGFYWFWMRSIFGIISCCVGSLDCVARFLIFSKRSCNRDVWISMSFRHVARQRVVFWCFSSDASRFVSRRWCLSVLRGVVRREFRGCDLACAFCFSL